MKHCEDLTRVQDNINNAAVPDCWLNESQGHWSVAVKSQFVLLQRLHLHTALMFASKSELQLLDWLEVRERAAAPWRTTLGVRWRLVSLAFITSAVRTVYLHHLHWLLWPYLTLIYNFTLYLSGSITVFITGPKTPSRTDLTVFILPHQNY